MREAINEAYKSAMKAGDKRRTATLRAVSAAIKDKDIEARGAGKEPLGEGEILPLLQKMVKQRAAISSTWRGNAAFARLSNRSRWHRKKSISMRRSNTRDWK